MARVIDKRVIVTGAAGAIGRAIASQIAARGGYEVVLVGRDERRIAAAAADVARGAGASSRVRCEVIDLALRASIAAFAARWTGPLHVLVNNAATAPARREVTAEGLEVQLATNVMSYFRMTRGLEGALAEGAPSRVVNVASYWAGGLDVDDLQFERRRYDNGAAYRQSKQANRMLSVAFAERLRAARISVNACHPGDVPSKLSHDLGFGGSESADEGARTPVWLATDSAGVACTGKYFEHEREARDPFAANRATVDALYEACARLDGRGAVGPGSGEPCVNGRL